jgi:hypothetical protein
MRGALVLLLLAAPAYGDNAPHQEGQYGGVTPGEPDAHAGHEPAKPGKPKRPPSKGTLTWIGFEAKDGGAEVFFQSVAPFELSQRVDGTSLVIHLNLSHLGHNTWRQIDTRFFDNPLSGIVARSVTSARASKDHPAHAAGIEARIAFKNPKDAKEAAVRTTTEADGMYYAYLTFPEGTELPASATPTRGTADPDANEPDAPGATAAPAPAAPAPAPPAPRGRKSKR